MGGDVTNPQSLNRYAYALNNPTSSNDPSGLSSALDPYPRCSPESAFAADVDCTDDPGAYSTGPHSTDPAYYCSYMDSNDASCRQMAGLWPNGDPIFGGGSGVIIDSGGGYGGLGSGPLSGDFGPMGYPTGGGWGPPCDFGTCGGPVPGNSFAPAVTAAIGAGAAVCVGSGACEAAALGVAAGVLVGLAAVEIQHVFQNRAERERIRNIARGVGVDPHELGDAVEVYKQEHGIPNDENLSYAEIWTIAQQVKQGLYKGLK